MARFRGTVKGNRQESSRLGSEKSGLRVTCNGWNKGVEVMAIVNSEGNDEFVVYETGGSNGRSRSKIIATIT